MSVWCKLRFNHIHCFQVDDLPNVPIGTIMSWIPKIDLSGDPLSLPSGWQFCDGGHIYGGPWDGGKTPDLNGLFLRGGNEASVLEREESQLQDHKHVDGGHSQ